MKLIKFNARQVQLLLLLFFTNIIWVNCKSQNLYTKIYESNGEFYVWSLAELKDSSIILHTKQVGAAETGLYHINVYGDTISKFNAWPPILGA